MRADVGIGPYEVVCNKALNYNLPHRKERPMKKAIMLLLCLAALAGCSSEDAVIGALPKYQSMEFCTTGEFQDFTDYGVFTYDSITAEDLEGTGYFTEVTAADSGEILAHIDNFEEWVTVIGGELEEAYHFDPSALSEGDYCYIDTKYGQPIGNGTYDKFDHYTVYFFDMETQILYYFHSNI